MPVSAGLDYALLQARFQNDAAVGEQNLGKWRADKRKVDVAGAVTARKFFLPGARLLVWWKITDDWTIAEGEIRTPRIS